MQLIPRSFGKRDVKRNSRYVGGFLSPVRGFVFLSFDGKTRNLFKLFLKERVAMMERKMYSEELAGIKRLTLEMGQKTVEAVKLAAQALIANDQEAAARARSLEKEVDDIYRQIDDRCIVSIATQQPMAGDLRFLV